MPWQMVCPKCGVFLWYTKPPGILERPACEKCSSLKTVQLRRVSAANGTIHIVWNCNSCQRYVKDGVRLWLPTTQVSEFLSYWKTRLPESNVPATIEEIPLLKDITGEPCAICGFTETEYNHFMPQAFKEDADIAPEWERWDKLGAWLCDYHHRLWHAKIAPLWALAQTKREAVR